MVVPSGVSAQPTCSWSELEAVDYPTVIDCTDLENDPECNSYTLSTDPDWDGLHHGMMGYDADDDVVVYWGGFGGDRTVGLSPLQGHVWQWNESEGNWGKQPDTTNYPQGTTSPAARNKSPFAYDSNRGVFVVFGGNPGSSDSGSNWLNDTWTYDAGTNAWTPIISNGVSGAPPGAYLTGAMEFDPVRDVMVLVTTNPAQTSTLSEVWEYDASCSETANIPPTGQLGGCWTRKNDFVSGTIKRTRHTLTWMDAPVNKMFLYGGCNYPVTGYLGCSVAYGDTWEYDPILDDWTEVAAGGRVRSRHVTVYDPARDQLITAFGASTGNGNEYHTEEFDGTSCSEVRRPPTAH
jgi:hypothetical protein